MVSMGNIYKRASYIQNSKPTLFVHRSHVLLGKVTFLMQTLKFYISTNTNIFLFYSKVKVDP